MFGVHGTGDTSGYGGLVQPIVYPGDAQRPYGGWFDEVADALEARLGRGAGLERGDRAASSSTAARSPSTSAARTCRSSPRCCATTTRLRFELCSGVSGVHYPDDTGARAARGLPPALDDPQPPDPARGHRPRRRPAHPEPRGDLPHQRLARARDLRHVRDRLRRPPGADPDPDARRLAGPPPAQGLPAGRHPGGVQGRRPSRRPTSGGPTTDDHRPGPRTPAGSATPAEGRVFTVTGQDWDSIVRGPRRGGRRAGRRQHGPAAPVDPRRAPADPRARGRDGDRGPLRHRLPPHRHREEHGVPLLGAGHHVLHPDGLPLAVLQRDDLRARRRAAARHRGRRSPRRPRSCGSCSWSSTGSPPTWSASPPAAWRSAR